jgi:hypothetical protein
VYESFKENSAALMAQRFDPGRGEPVGDPVMVADSIWEPSGNPSYAVSTNGMLILRRGYPDAYDLVTDRSGKVLDTLRRAGTWTHTFARQHDWVALAGSGLWLADLSRNSISSVEPGGLTSPVWAWGDTALAYSKNCGIAVRSMTTGQVRELVAPTFLLRLESRCTEPTSWSVDGGELLATVSAGDSAMRNVEIWRYRFADSSFSSFIGSPAGNSMHAVISPNGRHVAYVSDVTGAYEVYLAPYPAGTPAQRVSLRGGFRPRWQGNSQLLFYSPSGAILSVPIGSGDPPTIGKAVTVFPFQFVRADLALAAPFDVSPDGQRFVLHPPSGRPDDPLVMLLNWPKLVGLEPK